VYLTLKEDGRTRRARCLFINSWSDIGYLNSNPIYLCAMFYKTMYRIFMQEIWKNIVTVFDNFNYLNQKTHQSVSRTVTSYTMDTINSFQKLYLFIYLFIYLSIQLISFCNTRCITTLIPRVVGVLHRPHHTANKSASSDGACVRTKAVYFVVWIKGSLYLFALTLWMHDKISIDTWLCPWEKGPKGNVYPFFLLFCRFW
jgi:hypothetical protein